MFLCVCRDCVLVYIRQRLTRCYAVTKWFLRLLSEYIHSSHWGLSVIIIVDDVKAAGEGDAADVFVAEFNKTFALGSVSTGPGKTNAVCPTVGTRVITS